MEKIRTLRGFRDILGEELEKFKKIEQAFRKYSTRLGFREIELPILEKTDLFVRSIGDVTALTEKSRFDRWISSGTTSTPDRLRPCETVVLPAAARLVTRTMFFSCVATGAS